MRFNKSDAGVPSFYLFNYLILGYHVVIVHDLGVIIEHELLFKHLARLLIERFAIYL